MKREKVFSTGQAAEKVGVSRQTLMAWIAAGKVVAPPLLGTVRVWTEADIAKLQKVERRNYSWKGKKKR